MIDVIYQFDDPAIIKASPTTVITASCRNQPTDLPSYRKGTKTGFGREWANALDICMFRCGTKGLAKH
jgi:hypothetical protein